MEPNQVNYLDLNYSASHAKHGYRLQYVGQDEWKIVTNLDNSATKTVCFSITYNKFELENKHHVSIRCKGIQGSDFKIEETQPQAVSCSQKLIEHWKLEISYVRVGQKHIYQSL